MNQEKLKHYLRDAQAFADIFSKDPSTKAGAFLLMSGPSDFTDLTEGYNGFPRGVREDLAERQARPAKYAFYEHAERNAIFNLARVKLKGAIAVTTETPSVDCCRALASVGVSALIAPLSESWVEEPCTSASIAAAKTILFESLVALYDICQPQAAQWLDFDARQTRKLRQYYEYAQRFSLERGKDPQVSGTVLLEPGSWRILTRGYSGLPRGADDSKSERYHGDLRTQWVESSIRNAIYNAVRPQLKGSTALVTTASCIDCARALASVGVARVVYGKPSKDFLSRWGEAADVSRAMLRELGVETIELDV